MGGGSGFEGGGMGCAGCPPNTCRTRSIRKSDMKREAKALKSPTRIGMERKGNAPLGREELSANFLRRLVVLQRLLRLGIRNGTHRLPLSTVHDDTLTMRST